MPWQWEHQVLGAHLFLTTSEAETSEVVKEKMLHASSDQTVRSRSRTGKHSRQLKSDWTDAWESPDAPDPLPMPLQTMVSEPALAKIDKASDVVMKGQKTCHLLGRSRDWSC